MKKFIFFCFIFLFSLSSVVYASERLSPAIDVIASESSMVKAGIVCEGELSFDPYDFDESIGANIRSIKITSLPSEESGRLMLENLYVVKNQVIDREDFSLLKFVPKSTSKECSFSFIPSSGSYEIECVIKVLDEVNYSPIATNGKAISTWTGKDISTFGVLDGYDPDGDNIKFEITSYPKKGLIELTNATSGDYKYTPYENVTGVDSFSYRVRDEYGNYSAETTVSIRVKTLKTTLVFSDIDGDRAQNAVLVVGDGLMECEKGEDGKYIFNPEKTVTTEEFLSLVMRAMGAENVPEITTTRFADDKDISPEYKGYFESAFALGIISGERRTDGVYVNPKKEITLAEGAVIINKIIGASKGAFLGVFADEGDIPAWAKDDIISLLEVGILETENGKISPNSTLTRSQTARILMSLLEYRGKLKQ